MNEEARRDLCRKYVGGVSVAQLAADYNRSVHTVKGLLNTHLSGGRYRTLEAIRQPLREEHADERWKPLRRPTKTPYEISSYGRIRNLTTGEVLNLRIVFGYFSFEYTDQALKKRQAKLVHVLMAEHWLRNYDPALDTVHLDYDTFHNHYRNLRQMTAEERARRVVAGERSKGFKLTTAIVRQIKSSKASPTKLAECFGVSTMQVLRVQRGDCWAHILPGKTRDKQPPPATSPATVTRIKALLLKGKLSGKAIAALVGVPETTVSRIKRGKTYKAKSEEPQKLK